MAVADAGYSFLRAFVEQRVKVRALPIGPAAGFLNIKRWHELGDAFTTLMAIPYINIVCAAAGELMGQVTPAATFAKSQDLPPGLRMLLERDGFKPDGKSADVEYVPKTVFEGLYTAKVMNVAIVTGLPDAGELETLSKYNVVVFADHRAYDNRGGLFNVGIEATGNRAWFIHPDSAAMLPEILSEVLGCVFDISATTEPSPATDELPATTSPLSLESKASISRSASLAMPLRALSRAIASSTRRLFRFSRYLFRTVRAWTSRLFTRSPDS